MSKKAVPVARISSHFNIFRNINDAHDGEVTHDEEIVAVERFIRWHERQVTVGRQLLAQLQSHDEATSAVTPAQVAEPCEA